MQTIPSSILNNAGDPEFKFSQAFAGISSLNSLGGKITDNGVRALDVKVGDNVLFGAYAGTKVKVEGEELLVMKESDILAVLEG